MSIAITSTVKIRLFAVLPPTNRTAANDSIPERVVHAKGSGAHGVWECTDGLEDLCIADMFKKGSTCPITVRFSTVGRESGSSDLARDPRGFSVKFKTAEGNWDFVANNTPVFFLRDPAKFPHFIHTQKRHPATHLNGDDDSTLFWDYFSQNPESIHQVMILMSERGIPKGFRKMHGYFGHTLKIINKEGEWVYAQFHMRSNQGIENFKPEEAAAESLDYSQKDLYNAIENGDYPSWTMQVQIMTEKEAEDAWTQKGINVFDLTHVWPQKEYPLRTIGKLTLNENVKNYFAEVEQVAFAPSHMVPGIEPSADPVLQSRLFSYTDSHRHRLGVNYQQLPVNLPRVPYKMANFQRDGHMAIFNQGARPNYFSSIDPIGLRKYPYSKDAHSEFVGKAVSFLTEIRPEDFKAPRTLWQKVFTDDSRKQFIEVVSGHMGKCTDQEVIKRMIAIFRHVSPDLAEGIEKTMGIKGYEGIEDMTFNGSHNGMKTQIPANNLHHADVHFDNGYPRPHAKA